MGLRDITIHRTTIEYREQSISVRGISVTDIMIAAQEYGPQLALIFGKATSGELTGDIKTHLAGFVKDLPDVTAAVIALASDDYDPDTVKIAKQLPFNTQVELIEAIFNETFHSEAEVKKLIASLTRMITAASGALTEITPQVSLDGIGGLEGPHLSS